VENSTVVLTVDHVSIGLWLRTSPELRAYLEDLGRKGVAYARSIAPVGDRTTKTTTPGQYRDSLQFEVTAGKSRMSLRIFTDDYTAWWQEYGSKKVPRRAVLRRTLDYLASGHAQEASSYAGIDSYDAQNRGTQRRRNANRRARAGK
jgi:hypothetical protein